MLITQPFNLNLINHTEIVLCKTSTKDLNNLVVTKYYTYNISNQEEFETPLLDFGD